MTSQTQHTTSISADVGPPPTVGYDYTTVPGNQPASYGDTVFLWQTPGPMVPGPMVPLATQKVAGNTSSGSGTFTNVNVSSTLPYLVAYAVGPEVSNIAATVFIPAGGTGVPFAPALSVTTVRPDGVGYQYAVAVGMQPQQDGDWVGIWQGAGTPSLFAVPPLAWAAASTNMSSGSGWLAARTIVGGTYTLGYFKGGFAEPNPGQTTLACTVTFQT
ncbi:MAG TPA: hypothetical protein VF006_15305 [Longimicrobium sp.]